MGTVGYKPIALSVAAAVAALAMYNATTMFRYASTINPRLTQTPESELQAPVATIGVRADAEPQPETIDELILPNKVYTA